MSDAQTRSVGELRPQGLPQPLASVCLALVGIGVLAFLWGLATDPATAWRAFHVNFVYYAGMAQAGLALACAFVIIGARWPGPVRRICEGLAAWVPITLVLAVVGFFGRHHIFPWIEEPVEIKAAWLNQGRFYAMQLGLLILLTLLTLRFLRTSVREGLAAAGEESPRVEGPLARWTANWRGAAAERESARAALGWMAPVIALLYAFGFSFFGFDQVMSIDPYWFSNLFGGYFAWGGFLSAVAATALIAILHRGSDRIGSEITTSRLHDLGKMCFAFSIFWMYLFWSQYLVIWYGNLPEETAFLKARLGSQFLQDSWDFALYRLNEPYAKLTMAVWAFNWIIPFWVLLGARPKRTPGILGPVAALLLLGLWLERNILVWPSLIPGDGWAWLGLLQVGIAAGFLGGFVLVYLVYTRTFDTLGVPVSTD